MAVASTIPAKGKVMSKKDCSMLCKLMSDLQETADEIKVSTNNEAIGLLVIPLLHMHKFLVFVIPPAT